jgi:hypothetical protein
VSALALFRAGGALVLLAGFLHSLGHFAPRPDDPALALAEQTMQAVSRNILGVTTTLHAIVELLDWCFTLLSLLVGALNLSAARALASQPAALRAVSLVNVVGLGAVAVAAVAYRVIPPAVFYVAAAACFTAAAARVRA